MKPIVSLSLFIVSTILIFQSCKKDTTPQCQTIVFCPSKNIVIDTISGNDTICLAVPNFFSPNGDGINDLFYCFGKNIASFQCKIYSNNNLVHITTALDQQWDGFVGGTIPITVYSISVNATANTGQTFSYNGTLSAVGGGFVEYPGNTQVAKNIHAIGQWDNIQALSQLDENFQFSLPSWEELNSEVNNCL